MNEVLTIRGAAEVLAVSERTVRRLVAAGTLKAFRVGRTWRIRRVALDTYIDLQQGLGPAPAGAKGSIRDLKGWDTFR